MIKSPTIFCCIYYQFISLYYECITAKQSFNCLIITVQLAYENLKTFLLCLMDSSLSILTEVLLHVFFYTRTTILYRNILQTSQIILKKIE